MAVRGATALAFAVLIIGATGERALAESQESATMLLSASENMVWLIVGAVAFCLTLTAGTVFLLRLRKVDPAID